MNINEELFKRYLPSNKLAIIEKLTQSELLAVKPSTILRIIKEAGVGDSNKARSKFKTLRLHHRVGNHWNSTVDSIYNWKKDEIFLDVYIQGDDTDTNDVCKLTDFLSSREEVCCAKLHEKFSNGYEHTISANYDKEDRAKVIREILRTYVIRKYKVNE